MVTLGQLWSQPDLALVITSAPAGADDRPVSLVHTSELPTVADWLAGNEVVLTLGALTELADPVDARRYVESLVAAGACALGIGLGTGLPHPTMPAALTAVARDLDFPVFGVDEPVPLVALVAAFTRLSEMESSRELSTALQVQRRLISTAGSGDIGRLPVDLGTAVGLPVSLLSATGRPVAGPAPPVEVRGALLKMLARGPVVSRSPRLVPVPDGQVELVPVPARPLAGWVCIGPGADPARTTVRTRAALTSALVSLLESHPQLAEVLDSDLVYGRRSGAAEATAHLFERRLDPQQAAESWQQITGHRVPEVCRLTVFTVADTSAGTPAEHLVHVFRDAEPTAVVHLAGHRLAVVEARGTQEETGGQGRRGGGIGSVVEAIAYETGLEVVTSEVVGVESIAREWLRAAPRQRSAEARVSDLLTAVPAGPAEEFLTETLSPILGLPETPMLLATARAVARHGGNRELLAAELDCHRHTARARVRKLQVILGRDLSEPGEQAMLHLACLLHDRA